MGRNVLTSTLRLSEMVAFFICIYQSLIIKNMKKIKMEPTEFYHFRKLAFAISLAFGCTMTHGVYIVEASIDQLEKLGY